MSVSDSINDLALQNVTADESLSAFFFIYAEVLISAVLLDFDHAKYCLKILSHVGHSISKNSKSKATGLDYLEDVSHFTQEASSVLMTGGKSL